MIIRGNQCVMNMIIPGMDEEIQILRQNFLGFSFRFVMNQNGVAILVQNDSKTPLP